MQRSAAANCPPSRVARCDGGLDCLLQALMLVVPCSVHSVAPQGEAVAAQRLLGPVVREVDGPGVVEYHHRERREVGRFRIGLAQHVDLSEFQEDLGRTGPVWCQCAQDLPLPVAVGARHRPHEVDENRALRRMLEADLDALLEPVRRHDFVKDGQAAEVGDGNVFVEEAEFPGPDFAAVQLRAQEARAEIALGTFTNGRIHAPARIAACLRVAAARSGQRADLVAQESGDAAQQRRRIIGGERRRVDVLDQRVELVMLIHVLSLRTR